MKENGSRNFLESTLNGLSTHIVVVDAMGEILFTNKAYRDFAECNGVASTHVFEQANYLTVCDSARGSGSEYAHACATGLREVLAGSLPCFELEYPCHSPDERRWFVMHATLMPDGGPRRAVVAHDNVTERKLSEERTARANEQIKRLGNQVPGVLYQFQLLPDGTMTMPYASRALMDIYGVELEQVRDDATPALNAIHPDDIARVKASIHESAGTLDVWRSQHRVQLPDGGIRWVEGEATPSRETDGSVLWHGYIRDITEQKKSVEQLEVSNRKLEAGQVKLEEMFDGSIDLLVKVTEARDPYTAGHQRSVALLAGAIAEEMGMSEKQVEGLTLAGRVHDLGKIAVPADILSKPTRLNKPEFELVQMHAQTGYDILKDIEFPWAIAEMVYQHHERLDGSGYPRKLKGEEILVEARILGVADVVESMTSHRPYRPSLGIDKALAEIKSNRGKLYDPEVVDTCLKLFREKGFGDRLIDR